MNKVTCDECDKDFTIKLRTKSHGISIKEHYFLCSNCKHKYIAYVTDPECRKMQLEIKSLQKRKHLPAQNFIAGKITELEEKQQQADIGKAIHEIQSRLKPRMDELERQYI